MEQTRKDKIQRRCDLTMAFGFCASIYFLPISAAIVESLFGIIFCSYIVKRMIEFFHILGIQKQSNKSVSLKECFFIFLKAFKPVDSYLNKPLGIYILIAFVSLFVSYNPIVGLKGFFFKLLQGTFLYFLFIESMTTKKRMTFFLSVYLISLTLITTNGVYQYFVREGFIRQVPITDGRMTSSFKHANDFSGYLVMVMPLLICLIFQFCFTKNGTNIGLGKFFRSPFFRFLMIILFAGTVFCLGFTYSRAAWLSLFISICVMGLKKPKILLYILIAAVLFFLFFAPQMLIERKSNVIAGGFESIFQINERMIYVQEGMRIWFAHPIFGVGLNNYSLAAPLYKIRWGGYPHNCYIQMAAELGILGLGCFVWMLVRLFRRGLESFAQIQDKFSQNLFLGMQVGFLAFLMHSFFDTNFYSNKLGTLLWLILGFIVAFQRLELGKKL